MRYLAVIFCLFCCVGCNTPDAWDFFKSTGHTKTVVRSLDDFSAIEVNERIEFHVFVQDSVSMVELSAGKNLLPKIRTKVKNGVLYVTNDNKYDFMRSFSRVIRMNIYTKSLSRVEASGSEPISIFGGSSQLPFLDLKLEGCSGDLFLQADIGEMTLKSPDSSCKITFLGKADVLNYDSGYSFGPVDFSGASVRCANVLYKGTNDVYLNVSDSLTIEIKGIGNVYYKGTPKIEMKQSGSGKLLAMP